MSSILKPTLGSQLNLGHRLSQGLVGLWLFNEGSGNKVFDLSGNNMGTFGSGATSPSWEPGKFGSAINFDGDDVIDITTALANLGSNIYGTIVAWVKVTDSTPATHNAIFTVADTDGNAYIALVCRGGGTGDGQLYGFSKNAGNTNTWVLNTDVKLFEDNIWAQVAIVHNGIEPTLYFNGQRPAQTYIVDTTKAYWIDDVIADGGDNCQIGRRLYSNTIPGLFLTGSVGHLICYNRALNASEIAELYLNPFIMFDREPLPLWTAATQGVTPPVGMAGAMTTNSGYWGW